MEFDNTVRQQVLVCRPSRLVGNSFGPVRACGYCGILCGTIVGRDEHIDYFYIILLFRVRVMEKRRIILYYTRIVYSSAFGISTKLKRTMSRRYGMFFTRVCAFFPFYFVTGFHGEVSSSPPIALQGKHIHDVL